MLHCSIDGWELSMEGRDVLMHDYLPDVTTAIKLEY